MSAERVLCGASLIFGGAQFYNKCLEYYPSDYPKIADVASQADCSMHHRATRDQDAASPSVADLTLGCTRPPDLNLHINLSPIPRSGGMRVFCPRASTLTLLPP